MSGDRVAYALRGVNLGQCGVSLAKGLDMNLDEGTLTAVAGPNGAGKTTFLRLLLGEIDPLSGHIHRPIGRIPAYLPQRNEIDLTFPATVAETALLGLYNRLGAFGGIDAVGASLLHAALHRLGLGEVADCPVSGLSGGQAARLLFCRVLLEDAPVVLLDEPFAAIDAPTACDLAALLAEWAQAGKTVVCVLHDLSLVGRFFPKTLLLSRDTWEYGPTDLLLRDGPLRRAGLLSREAV